MNISPVSVALQGLQTNISSLDRAAQQISAISGGGGDVVDIAAAFVTMMTAETGAEASIAMIKSENDVQRQIIDMFV
jgi:hypothetical protein